MPTSTEITRDSGAGTISGRPASAAAATDKQRSEISPAGKPISVNSAPPTAAISSVSAVRSSVRRVGMESRHRRDQCRAGPEAVKWPHWPRGVSARDPG